MLEELLTAVTIILLTMLKFIAGPILGYAAGFSYLATVAITITGMMLSVLIFTFLGRITREKILSPYLPKRKFTKRSRQFVRIWLRFGEKGVAMLTPLVFTPIGGTLLLIAAGSKKKKIITYMASSAFIWSPVLTGIIYYFGSQVIEFLD